MGAGISTGSIPCPASRQRGQQGHQFVRRGPQSFTSVARGRFYCCWGRRFIFGIPQECGGLNAFPRLGHPPASPMAHAVLYQARIFFYPIGNTSAVVLTETLAPEEPANLLLLGCGDPRNIFFTVYNEADDGEQQKIRPLCI